jgi:RNA polymerase sigma factor (sigma-70 family)
MNQQKNGHDAGWLQTIFQQYEGPLVRYASQLVGDTDRGRDIVQDVFVRLCRQQSQRAAGHIAPWLYTVCRNRALDVRRKERPMRSLTTAVTRSTTDERAGPAESAERREVANQAQVWLDRLPENQQEVIRLKIEHGMKYREISEVTGLSVTNVGYLIHQGIVTLRRQFERQQQPEERA